MSLFNFGGKNPETMLLLDQTGSETYATSSTNDTPRYKTLAPGVKGVIERLAQIDREQGAGQSEEGGGGLYTVGFADGRAFDYGDINPENFTNWWNSIQWDGGTLIMPGYNALMKHFNEEFGSDPNTVLFLLYIGDGGGRDFVSFENAVMTNSRVYVAAAIVGDDHDAQKALSDFRSLESRSTHVRVFDFTQASADEVTTGLLTMIG